MSFSPPDFWADLKGFLADDEAAALAATAARLANRGPVLEIGSYCGKSTICLAQGIGDSGTTVFALDHHRGSEEHQPGEMFHDPDLYDGIAWRRAAAYLLDVVAIAVLCGLAWVILGLLAGLSFGLLIPLQVTAVAVLPALYHTVFIGSSGATPGMRFFDVELRSWTGARPDYLQAFLQTALFYVTVMLTTWLILAVALFNNRCRTLHDFLAGTVCVRHTRLQAAGLQTA